MARCIAVALVALLAARQGRGATFVVQDPEFDPALASDSLPGDGACATPGGTCALQAALEEANALPGPDVVRVDVGVEVMPGQSISDPVSIEGPGGIVDPLAQVYGVPTLGVMPGASLRLSGITLHGFRLHCVSGSSTTIEGVTWTYRQQSLTVIDVVDATLTITDSTIQACFHSLLGQSGGDVHIERTTLSGGRGIDYCFDMGGGSPLINTDGGTLELNRVRLVDRQG